MNQLLHRYLVEFADRNALFRYRSRHRLHQHICTVLPRESSLQCQAKLASFGDLLASPFAIVAANKTDYVACDPKSFMGVDPAPGVDKECYCDDKRRWTDELIKANQDNWEMIRQEKLLREQMAKADAESEAALEREEEEQARLEEKLK